MSTEILSKEFKFCQSSSNNALFIYACIQYPKYMFSLEILSFFFFSIFFLIFLVINLLVFGIRKSAKLIEKKIQFFENLVYVMYKVEFELHML